LGIDDRARSSDKQPPCAQPLAPKSDALFILRATSDTLHCQHLRQTWKKAVNVASSVTRRSTGSRTTRAAKLRIVHTWTRKAAILTLSNAIQQTRHDTLVDVCYHCWSRRFQNQPKDGRLVPSLDCWRSGLPSAQTPQGSLGVKLSQRLVSWKCFRIHSSRGFFFHMPCNGSAIQCTLIHQAPSPERSSTDYEPLTPPASHAQILFAQSRSISCTLITACCRMQDPSHCLLHRPVRRQADCTTTLQIAVAWSVKALGRPHTNLPEPPK
jgi:hypothetical protein